MPSNCILTIAIPNYNYGKYLKRAIDSALATERQDVEVFVADNCSDDESLDILESYDDPRLRYVVNEENIGLYPNWNCVLKNSRGKYFKLLQSDDWLEASFFEDFFKVYSSNPEADVFALGYNTYIGDRNVPVRSTLPLERGLPGACFLKSSESSALKTIKFSMPTLHVIRRDLLDGVGGYYLENNMRTDSIAFAAAISSKSTCLVAPVNGLVVATYVHSANDRRRYTSFEAFRDEVLYLRQLDHVEYEGGNTKIKSEIHLNRAGACLYFPVCLRKARGRQLWGRFFRELFSDKLICFKLGAYWDLYKLLRQRRKLARLQ